MSSIRERIEEYGLRRIAQAVVVAAFLVFVLGIVGMWRLLAFVASVWFEDFLGLVNPEDFAAHRVHDLAFATIMWTIVIGMASQLRSPRRNVAGQLMALLALAALVVAFAVTGFWDMVPMVGIIGSFVVVATLLHPAGRELVTWVDSSRVNRVLLALIVVAAVPLLAFSAAQVDLQTADHTAHDHGGGGGDAAEHQEHAEKGHFMLMGAFGFLVVGMGLLASLSPPGWRISAWLTGAAVALFGAASIVYPDMASSVDLTWGLVAIAWAAAFVVTGELTRDSALPSPYGTPGERTTPK